MDATTTEHMRHVVKWALETLEQAREDVDPAMTPTILLSRIEGDAQAWMDRPSDAPGIDAHRAACVYWAAPHELIKSEIGVVHENYLLAHQEATS